MAERYDTATIIAHLNDEARKDRECGWPNKAAKKEQAAAMLAPESLLRPALKPGERLVCYCPPDVCQAPRGFSGPCNRAPTAGVAPAAPTHEARRWCKGDGEWTTWQPVPPDKLAERRADPTFEVRTIAHGVREVPRG